ncbi:MAG: GEVED domain-containing protein [Rikenellaceae bacterium]
MKKLNLLMMLLASFTLVSLSSCGDDDDKTPVTPPTDIKLTVSGGASIEMGAENISKDVTVTASSAAVKDIVVKLSSDAAEGEASFEAAEITIKAGTTVATGKITFMAAKFPKGTEAKKITVTIGTLTEGVKVDVATTEFSVRGEGAKEPANLTVTANGTSFNTTAAAVPVSVTFTLSEALTENLGIKITLGEGTSDIFKTMFPAIPTMPIVAGETTFKYDFEMPKGIAGKLVLNFAFDPANPDVMLKTTTLSATFIVDEPVIPSLCAITETNASWGRLSGFTIGDKTVAIAQADPAYQDMLKTTIANVTKGDLINVGAISNTGEGSQPLYCLAWVDWNKDNNVDATEIVGKTEKKAATEAGDPAFLSFAFTAPQGTANGTYHMRVGTNYKPGESGCANPAADESRTAYDLTINYTAGTVEPGVDPTFALVNPAPGVVVVPNDAPIVKTFNVTLSKAAEEAQTIDLAVTSTVAASGTLSASSVVFAAGETSKDVTITFSNTDFTSEAVVADVTVTATSHGSVLETTGGTLVYSVKGTKAGVVDPPVGDKQDLNYRLGSESGSEVIFTSSNETKEVTLYVQTSAKNQKGNINFRATVTGLAAADYILADNGVVVTSAESGFQRFYLTINKSAIGKTMVVTITSDDTTIEAGKETLSFPVSLAQAPANPFDYKVDYTVSKLKTLEIIAGGWIELNLKTTGDVVPETTLIITPSITGGIEIGGIDNNVIEMSKSSKSIWIQVSNFEELANGTTGVLTFTSKYTTFADGAGVTFTIKK